MRSYPVLFIFGCIFIECMSTTAANNATDTVQTSDSEPIVNMSDILDDTTPQPASCSTCDTVTPDSRINTNVGIQKVKLYTMYKIVSLYKMN